MSADSLRKGVITNKVPGHSVRPQAVSEKTFMESVAGLINEVGLTPQPYGHSEDGENMVTWAKFEKVSPADFRGIHGFQGKAETLQIAAAPLLLAVGYAGGVQVWAININGEANEVFSWKRPNVKEFQLLPTPSNEERDQHRNSRPIAAIFEANGTSNYLTFISLRTGETLKSSKFIQGVLGIVANPIAIAVSFLDKIIVVDPLSLETKVTISQLGIISSAPTHNPMSLGPTWLAYTDRRIFPRYQSGGGVEMAGSLSYTASMLYAAKSLTKGLKGLGETVASSITGHRVPGKNENVTPEPGIVTVINLTDLKSGEFCLSDTSTGNSAMHAPVIAHFVAHRLSPVTALSFDPSGMLIVTADKQGHDFNVFRIHPHPLSSALGSVQHLYVLHRGDTVAKVQNISFAPDSRWVAVSTLRGTTHVFPITPYGGPISARTHTSHKVVNRLSRFHRTAGLDDAATSGRHSPVPTTTFGSAPTPSVIGTVKSSELAQPPNSLLAPTASFPHTIPPMAQLRQDTSALSSSSSPKNSPPVTKAKTFLQDEKSIVVSIFAEPRSQPLFNPAIAAVSDKRKKIAVDSLFVMTSYGNLIEYFLDPKPSPDSLQRNALHGKVSDDTAIELAVHAKAQWKLNKPSFIKELQPPLQPNNTLVILNAGSNDNNRNNANKAPNNDENIDERWLAQVEITTHHGPHRRLWMGPQFNFKVFNPSLLPGMPKMGVHDIETVEVNVTNRPARSNPVNMPVYSSLLPFVIEDSSGSSLEQSPRLVDHPYCQSDAVVVNNDSLIKENIAEAMMENAGLSSREAGGCQSQGLGSCDDLSSGSSIDSASSPLDAPLTSSFCIDAGFPFPD